MLKNSPGRQRGFSVLALSIAVAAAALLAFGYARKQVWVADAQAGQALGDSLNQVASAVENYRSTNFLQLTSAAPAVAGFANPNAPTIAELKAAGLLNAAVANQWPDGNTYNIQVFKQPAGCIGPQANCNVYSVLWMTNPIVEGNGNPDIHRLGALVGEIHGSASYSVIGEAANITGGAGAWVIANPDAAGRAGIVVVVAGLGGNWPQFLRVGDPRDPAFSGNVTTANWLKVTAGAGQNVTAGTACAAGVPNGALGNDANGRLLTCQAGTWVAGDGSKSVVLQSPVSVPGGQNFPVIACGPGGTPWASYSAQASGINLTFATPYTQLNYSVTQAAGNWSTLTQAVAPPAAPVVVNANQAVLGFVPIGVFSSGCSYP